MKQTQATQLAPDSLPQLLRTLVVDGHSQTKNEPVMKTHHKKRTLTFGDLVAAVYRVCGKHRACGIVRLAVNAHVVEFRRHQHFVVS